MSQFLFWVLLLGNSTAAEQPSVLVSIKPVHSLVAAVMEGVAKPSLLVTGSASPHEVNLKPSQATMLEQSTIIFWIGGEFETFLEKPVQTIGAKAQSVELMDAPGIKILTRHEDAKSQHGDDHEHGHEHGSADPHIWLDPENAVAMVDQIALVLVGQDPANATKYQTNAAKAVKRVRGTSKTIETLVAPARGKGFITFHDAYHYFEDRFDLPATASITVNPEVLPGAARIKGLREKMRLSNVNCVFVEPQFDRKITSVITEGTTIKTAALDPLGANLEDGPDLYFEMMLGMARSLNNCLTKSD